MVNIKNKNNINKKSKNITKSSNKKDCPNAIFKTARTNWQKEVALEFVDMSSKVSKINNDVKWLKYIIVTVLLGISLNIVINLL